jgi:putative transposase
VESSGRKRPVHLPPIEDHTTPVIVYVTVCTKDRKKILGDPIIRDCLHQAWQTNTSWLVGKYLIMPDHVICFVLQEKQALRRYAIATR